MPFTIGQIRAALARHRPQPAPREPGCAEAAVALVLAGAGEQLSFCAIRRAEHPLDPWSGHMALPGGRACAEDGSPRAVAERETWEEVGLRIGGEHWLASLSELMVRIGRIGRSGGGDRRMVLSPVVYYVGEDLPALAESEEVAQAYWVPLAHLWDPRNAGHVEWEKNGSRLLYPAIHFRGHAIWGITFRVLTLFSDVLDAPLPHLEEIPGPSR